MVTSTSRLAYQDCFELMDQALEAPRGIRFPVSSRGIANHFRVRLHTARDINRKDNKDEYEKGHALWGCSAYDELTVQIRTIGDQVYVCLLKISAENLEIEVIGEEENVFNQSPDGNLREAEREGPSESPGQAPITPRIDRRF